MKKTLIAVTAALGIQFLLLHSHKLGSMHWAWVSGGSLTLFVLLYGVIAARHSTTGMNSRIAAGGVLCVLVPPAIYLTADWLQAPSHVVNAIFQGGPLFLLSNVFVSGGWLFALAFLLSQRWRSCSSDTTVDRRCTARLLHPFTLQRKSNGQICSYPVCFTFHDCGLPGIGDRQFARGDEHG